MSEIYDISNLKQALEEITGKQVYLYDKENLPTPMSNIDNKDLEMLTRKSFDDMLQRLAIKNAFIHILKQYIKIKYNISDGKKLDDYIRDNKVLIEKFYNNLVLEKELLNKY